MKIKRIKTKVSYTQYYRMLLETGFKKLGEGACADVFGDETVAVKIGYLEDNNAYLDFVRLALKNQDDPWFPKIFEATIFQHRRGDYIVVEMERLKLPAYKRGFLEKVSVWFELKTANMSLIDYVRPLKEDKKFYRQMCRTFKKLKPILHKNWNCPDFQYCNFMLRKKQVVIIDPVV